jgi:hypothetical protein
MALIHNVSARTPGADDQEDFKKDPLARTSSFPRAGGGGGAVGATRKNRAGPVSLYSRFPPKCPLPRDGVLWGDPATAGTGRFFQTVGQAPAADVTQSAATGTEGCSLAAFIELAVTYWAFAQCPLFGGRHLRH